MTVLPSYISPETAAGIQRQRMCQRWGNLNRYICDSCRTALITTDVDTGTTPFLTKCGEPGCKGVAQSESYRVPPGLTPTHAWYRPDDEEFAGLSEAVQDHCLNGGLRLRPLTDEELGWLQ